MNANRDCQNDLRELRKLASQREWNEQQVVIDRLLMRLNQTECVGLGIQYIEAYIPRFEHYYPEQTWPRRLLNRFKAALSADPNQSSWPEAPDEFTENYPKPGAGNFRNALLELWKIGTGLSDAYHRARQTRRSIYAIFMADLTESWGRSNPELWDRYRHPQNTHDMFVLPYQRWMSPEIAERDISNWLRLANDIEKRLEQSLDR